MEAGGRSASGFGEDCHPAHRQFASGTCPLACDFGEPSPPCQRGKTRRSHQGDLISFWYAMWQLPSSGQLETIRADRARPLARCALAERSSAGKLVDGRGRKADRCRRLRQRHIPVIGYSPALERAQASRSGQASGAGLGRTQYNAPATARPLCDLAPSKFSAAHGTGFASEAASSAAERDRHKLRRKVHADVKGITPDTAGYRA